MLANDSNEGKNQSEFFLVIRPHQAVAELMAECPSCGAITSFALELAWQLDVVSCSECNRAMRLDEHAMPLSWRCGRVSFDPCACRLLRRSKNSLQTLRGTTRHSWYDCKQSG